MGGDCSFAKSLAKNFSSSSQQTKLWSPISHELQQCGHREWALSASRTQSRLGDRLHSAIRSTSRYARDASSIARWARWLEMTLSPILLYEMRKRLISS